MQPEIKELMKMLLKKRGYFFILDATLALFVLVIGVFLIVSFYLKAPETSQVGLLSEDLFNFLSSTKIKDLNNAYAGIGGILWNQDIITDPENSLLQQIGEFYAKNNVDIAEKFIQNVSETALPYQYKYELWMNNEILYPKSPSAEHLSSKGNTSLLLTSKKLTFGIINQTTGNIWGPYKAEVFVWEK